MGIDKDLSRSAPEETQHGAALRRQAEEQINPNVLTLRQPQSESELQRLVHELGVHQIELEMQNKELCRTQEELELSRNTYVELYDFAPVGYFTLDPRDLIREINLEAARLLGSERGLLLKSPFVTLIADAAEREIFSKHRETVIQSQGSQICYLMLKRNDGLPFCAQLRSVAKEKIDGECGYISTTIMDVTERRRIDAALKFQTAILAQVNDAVVAIDSSYRITYWNKAAERQYHLTSAEVIGRHVTEAYSHAWCNADDERLAFASLELTGSWIGENVHIKKNGEQIAVRSSVAVLKDEPGDSVGLLAVIRDITELKRVQDALHTSREELELRVTERTAELSSVNEQLLQEIQEHKKAEESLLGAFEEIKQLKERLQEENIYLQQEVARKYNFGELIGQSAALSYVFFRLEQVAPQEATVLLLGETGTGKGVVADAIHLRSAHKDRPMITVNCASLPANLIESELFGRERGAFTGAHDRQIGRFELADGGTLFLDEIGEIPLELQSKLLRVVQNGEFERLGSPRTIKVKVRIIAASNRNLEEEIKNGRFREDLFYRLNVFPITMPPLRQRTEDIPLLVNHFVTKFNKKMDKKIETISQETMTVLQEYHWPGNVRELESVIERAVITSRGTALEVLDRFEPFRKIVEPAEQEIKAMADLEQHHILQALQKTGWRVDGKNGAALLLDLNPSTLRARMRKYGIQRQ
jgi:PAS domain S-box-containing protein